MKTIANKVIILSGILLSPIILFGQEATSSGNENNIINIDLNWILTGIALFLLLPIYFTSKTLLYTIKDSLIKEKPNSLPLKKTGIIILLLSLAQFADAKSVSSIKFTGDWITWTLVGVIVLEAYLIIFFALKSNKYFRPMPSYMKESAADTSGTREWFRNIWEKMNKFKPISEEANIDTGHSYDGIRELDNITPPWFVTGFIASIIFAGVYLYRYHVGHNAPLQIEELKIELAQAEEEKAKFLASQANNIDENTITMLGSSDIAAGKALFSATCIACHAQTGGSMPGGVGPNLTDDYWIHGGTIKDVFKTIKYGWPEKGMISWKDTYSPKQIAQLASFVKSLKGTNPPNAKEPQGELFNESASVDTLSAQALTAKR